MKSQVEAEKKLCVSHTPSPHDKRKRKFRVEKYMKVIYYLEVEATSEAQAIKKARKLEATTSPCWENYQWDEEISMTAYDTTQEEA